MGQQHIDLVRDDLDDDFYEAARLAKGVAWDIETSGLDWSTSKIGTCQVALPGRIAIVVLRDQHVPKYLAALIEDEAVTKVFHHAPFDLRFLAHHWGAVPASVACTKIASKVLDPNLPSKEHSLKPVLKRHLGVTISKAQQVSDWMAADLTPDQLAYAAADVAHLLDLYAVLTAEVARTGHGEQLRESYRYLPTRVALDLRGAGDVFAY